MKSVVSIKKIRNYALVAFVVPLLAMNSCLLIYKFIGNVMNNIKYYPNFNWSLEKIEQTYNEHNKIVQNIETYSLTNCPKNVYQEYYITHDNQVLLVDKNVDLIKSLISDNKIKSVIKKRQKHLNVKCVKNHPSIYSMLQKFSLLETILLKTKDKSESNKIDSDNTFTLSGFSEIKNPYFYGEVSISRTARVYPTNLIFKPAMFITAFFLILYWRLNYGLMKKIKSNFEYSKFFVFFGIGSAIFLILHSIFLGIKFDNDFYRLFRRVIVLLFIIFEVVAQTFLVINFYKVKQKIIKLVNIKILRYKIILVSILVTVAIISIPVISSPGNVSIKHALEWDYFMGVLSFYLLTFFFWKKK